MMGLFLLFILFPTNVKAAEKTKANTVRVGWYEDSYHITGKDGSRSGYGYEFEQSIASYTGWHYQYINKDWTSLVEMLQNGKIDIMSGISYTKDRAKTMLFSDLPMGEEKYYLYIDSARTGVTCADLSALNGKRIVVLKGSVQATQFSQWEKEHNIKTQQIYLNDVEKTKKLFKEHKVDGVISTETPIWTNFGLSSIVVTGKSNIYYAINKKRPELKDKLDNAMRKMEDDNPFYADELYKKYLSTSSNAVLSDNEKKWIENHGKIKVGYLKNDSGFSTFESRTGKLSGIINDYINFSTDCFGKNSLEFKTIGFDSQAEQMKALKDGKIDMIFHMSQNPYAAEQNNLILSNTVLESPLAVVTRQNSFNEESKNTIAVSKDDNVLKWHISYNYPKWKIIEFDSIKSAEKSVRTGKVDCLLTRTGTLSKYIEDKKLHCVFLSDSGNVSFAARRSDTTLITILNKTLKCMQSSMLTGALASYDNVSKKATVIGFIKDNIWVVSTTFTAIFLLILLVILWLLRKARVAEGDAKKAKIQAEKANAAKSTFLFNMSHDIRTPMNALLGYNQLMKDKLTDSKLLYYQKQIEKAGNLLLSIINNVLDMARIESGKAELDENYNEVGNILQEVCEVFNVEAKEKGINLTYETQVSHKHIMCDKAKIQKILINLVSNAVKYTSSGGMIVIRSKEIPYNKDGFVQIKTEVIDSGIGISKEYLPYIFDSFSRERNTTMGKVAGTGLGMSIVKSLVDMMGGSITVESELGKGSKFTLILSFKIADEKYYIQNTKEISSNEKLEILQGKHILLAEDNDLNAEIAITILEESGLKIDRVEDGIKCVDKIEQMPSGSYDLILMDIQMPNMDGYKATKIIRNLKNKQKASIPIVAMTANAFEEDRKEAFNNGMNGHIAKPIDVEKMEEVLISVLK